MSSRLSGLTAAVVIALAGSKPRTVDAHGSLYIPTPRNAMDSVLPEFANGKSPTQGCTCTNGNPGGDSKTGCDRGLRGPDGQSCLWWSQGCSIGCEKCVTDPSLNFDRFVGKAPQDGTLPGPRQNEHEGGATLLQAHQQHSNI